MQEIIIMTNNLFQRHTILAFELYIRVALMKSEHVLYQAKAKKK